MVTTASTVPTLHFPLLLVVADYDYIADTERWVRALRTLGAAACGEAVALQVRAKHARDDELRDLAGRAREAVPLDVPLFLNGNAAHAAALGFSGVHWPEATPATARTAATPALRSAAVHSIGAAMDAVRTGVDLLVYGSVFEPGSKPGTAAGTAVLQEIARTTAVPVIAIGGITPERVVHCLRAGARGVGVVSGILGDPQPAEAMHRYLAALAAAPPFAPVHATQLAQGEITR